MGTFLVAVDDSDEERKGSEGCLYQQSAGRHILLTYSLPNLAVGLERSKVFWGISGRAMAGVEK